MTKLFHIKIQVTNAKVDALFNFDSKTNLIVVYLVSKITLEFHDHIIPYPLGWLKRDAQFKVKKQCNIKFSICANFIDEVELDIVSLNLCGVDFGSPYIYMRDFTLMPIEKQGHIIKDENPYVINAHKSKSMVSLICSTKPKVDQLQ